jgi:hypothetical protein
MGETRNIYKTLARNPEVKRSFGIANFKWENNIKKYGVRTWTGFIWLRIGTNVNWLWTFRFHKIW